MPIEINIDLNHTVKLGRVTEVKFYTEKSDFYLSYVITYKYIFITFSNFTRIYH